MPRHPLTSLGLAACLVLTPAGCGSSSGSSTSTSSTAGAGGTTQSSTAGSTANSGSGADNSIQTYGSAATSTEKAALADSALSFFRALAASDYAKVCAGLIGANRQQLQAFKLKGRQGSGCATALKTLVPPTAAAEARKAASGAVTGVRIKGDTAFVLFRPSGGPESYFVMKRENGEWKAISLAPGAPLNPSLPGG